MRIKTRLLITALLPLLMGVVVGVSHYFENRQADDLNRYRDNMQRVSWAVFELNMLEGERHFGETQQRVTRQWWQRYQSLGVLLQQTPQFFCEEDVDSFERLRQSYGGVGVLSEEINHVVGGLGDDKKLTQDSRNLLIMLSGQRQVKLNEMLVYMDRIVMSISQRYHEQREFINLFTYGIIGLVIFFTIFLSILINRNIIKSVSKLYQGTEVIGSGIWNYRINLRSDDEFGQLSQAFDKMSQRLYESYTELEGRIAELTVANRELETFSHATAHNFYTPLRALNGFSSVLEEEYGEKLDETGKRYIREIQDSSREMEVIINSFLKLTKVTTAVIKRQSVDLSQLATAILQEHDAVAGGRRVTWEVAAGLTAHGDASLLHTALENLLDNAWKFTEATPDAHISFGAETQAGQTVYRVKDNGVGFDMSYRDKLFQPFKRLHRVTEFPGTSLGLAITQRIIARHGGQIWAESATGQGAAFYFTLAGGS